MTGAPRGVAVVTDSTAYLPPDMLERYRLTVVPLQVVVGGRSLAEGIEVSSDEVARALREWRPGATSRASPPTLAAAVAADLRRDVPVARGARDRVRAPVVGPVRDRRRRPRGRQAGRCAGRAR